MADIKTFLTLDDFYKLSEFIVREFSAVLVPTTNLDAPEEIKLRTVEDIKEHLIEFRNRSSRALSYFIVSPQWTVESIYFDKIEPISGLDTFYCALNRYGGPHILLLPNYGFPRVPEGKIIVGLVSDYPYYISGSFLTDKINGYKTIDRPESIVTAMKQIKSFIRKDGGQVINRTRITRIAYAMQGAIGQLEKGSKLMEGDLTFEKK